MCFYQLVLFYIILVWGTAYLRKEFVWTAQLNMGSASQIARNTVLYRFVFATFGELNDFTPTISKKTIYFYIVHFMPIFKLSESEKESMPADWVDI